MMTLGDDEIVNQFVHCIRNLVANIQVISESLENKNPRLTFSEAYKGSTYTEEKWKLHFATSTHFSGHLALLHRTQASGIRLQCPISQGGSDNGASPKLSLSFRPLQLPTTEI